MDEPSTTANNRAWAYPVRIGVGTAICVAVYTALPQLSYYLTYHVLGLRSPSALALAVRYFTYTAPRLLLLMAFAIGVMGVVRTFFRIDKVRATFDRPRTPFDYALAAMLGVVTPFCSCAAVPMFIGFTAGGVPLGLTFTFLVAAPLVNEVAVVMLFALFGMRVAALYMACGLAIAVCTGWLMQRLRMERYVQPWVFDIGAQAAANDPCMRLEDRLRAGIDAVSDVLRRTWPYVLLGVGIAAAIHAYMPSGVLAAGFAGCQECAGRSGTHSVVMSALPSVFGRQTWWSVPAATILGVPMYASPAGVIPIVQALLAKGASPGVALAFMMAVVGISLPELVLLRKVLQPRLIAVFVGVVSVGIMLVGYLFNALL